MRNSGAKIAVLALLLAALLCRPARGQGVIISVAGADSLFPGDGKPAVEAPLGNIAGIAIGPGGNLFIADQENHLVMKVSPDGILNVIAGNGIPGFSGDGGAATSASLLLPFGVTTDPTGSVFIADTINHRIRKVTPAGIISTFAGNGQADSSGDGGPATRAALGGRPITVAIDSSGSLYIADPDSHRIRKVTPDGLISTIAGTGQPGFSGDGGPATRATINFPAGLAVDSSGALYIADTGNFRVRKVTPQGVITTVAGGGFQFGDGVPATTAALIPIAVITDSGGNVYVSDVLNSSIRKITPAGSISTIAGTGRAGFSGDDGPAVNAALNFPSSMAVDAADNLYVADRSNSRVRKISVAGVITTVAGNGQLRVAREGIPAVEALLRSPDGVAVDPSGNLFFTEREGNRVRQVTPGGIITTKAGTGRNAFSGDGGQARNATLAFPRGLALDSQGSLYVVDSLNHRIRKIDPDGTIRTIAGNGIPTFAGDGGPAVNASIALPEGIAIDAAGNLYIGDTSNQRVRKINAQGIISTLAGNGQKTYSGDGGPATAAALDAPTGVTVDAAGNIYIADTNNQRIRKVTPAGVISTVAGNGKKGFSGDGGPATAAMLSAPNRLTLDPAGNLYIADQENNRVRKVTPQGVISTVAGTGQSGASGDGGPAISAALNSPNGLAIDRNGNLFIADLASSRIRAVLAAPPGIQVSPTALTFAANATGAPPPAQSISVTGTIPGIPFTVNIFTPTGIGWLSANLTRGAEPATLLITADPANLAPGTYSGTVTIIAPNANPSTQNISVRLVVGEAQLARLSAGSKGLTFSLEQGSGESAQALSIANAGGGSVAFTAQTQTASGGDWLAVSGADGKASPAAPASVGIRVNPAGLSAGTYTGRVIVEGAGTGDRIEVPVTLTVSGVHRSIVLSATGLTFLAVEGGGTTPPQSFGIANARQNVMTWEVSASGADTASRP